MSNNIPLAIGLVVIASVCFALGAVGQFSAVGHAKGSAEDASRNDQAMSFGQVVSLLRNPRWLGSTALIGLGAALHLVALNMAPVTVIQPVGILAVAWSVLLSSRIHGYRNNSGVWAGVAMTVVGIVAFTLLSARFASEHSELRPTLIVVSAIGVAVAGLALALFGQKAPAAFRCVALASGGAILYGLASALMKTMFKYLEAGHPILSVGVLLPVVGIIATYAVGGWFIQQAHAVGHAEIVVASLTTVDPVVAVLFGILVLGEGVTIPWWAYLGMVAAAALAVAGALVLSKYHPEVLQRREAAAAAREPSRA
ncbi:DMT family protein [Mariniluteicoccus flavus]